MRSTMDSTPAITALRFAPLDARARDGLSHIVRDARSFAIARWDGARWVHPCTTTPLDFYPTEVAR